MTLGVKLTKEEMAQIINVPLEVINYFPWVYDTEGLTERDIIKLKSTAAYQGHIVGKRLIEFKAVVIHEFKKIFHKED